MNLALLVPPGLCSNVYAHCPIATTQNTIIRGVIGLTYLCNFNWLFILNRNVYLFFFLDWGTVRTFTRKLTNTKKEWQHTKSHHLTINKEYLPNEVPVTTLSRKEKKIVWRFTWISSSLELEL